MIGGLLFLAVSQCIGCATYEFNIIQPGAYRQHISEKPIVVSAGPVEYTFQTVEGHLVIQVKNASAALMEIAADQSREIDPAGQEHSIRGTILQPGGQMKLVLPPMPHLDTQGPQFGFGMGVGAASGGPEGDRLGFAWDDPRYGAAVDGRQPWDWPADAQVKLILTFQRLPDKPFTQDWVFSKQKM
jgi:hypothetical protein